MDAFDAEIRNLIQINLRASPGDSLLVVTDDGPFRQPVPEVQSREILATKFCHVAESLGLNACSIFYAAPGRPGCEPPVDVWKKCFPEGFIEHFSDALSSRILVKTALNASDEAQIEAWLIGKRWPGNAVVALSKDSITHTRFSDFLSRFGQCRMATMPGLEPSMFFGVLRADWNQVKERSERVAQLLSFANSAVILSAGDNRLQMSLEGREGVPDTGIIGPGEVGNLPGGEAFIAPVEGTANGRIAIGPRCAPTKWVLAFQEGRLKEIEGSPPFERQVRELIAKDERRATLAELGVGTNKSATSTDSTVEAEKILGTVHVAIGDNFSFGGRNRVDFHKDFICFNPTLLLENPDKTEIVVVQNGNFAL